MTTKPTTTEQLYREEVQCANLEILQEKINQCQRSLANLDIIASDQQLIIRDATEYLAIQKFRANRLKMCESNADQISQSLKSIQMIDGSNQKNNP